jgi:Fe2+ transport system protein FeoA
MVDGYVVCPLCGFEFKRGDTLCQHGCPMRTTCNLIRCPSCEYEFPEKPRAVSWLERLFGGKVTAEPEMCEQFQAVSELAPGETSEVVSLATAPARRNSLAVFGLVPGSEITLIQHRPACVVRIGETELALDPEIARVIVVRRPSAEPAPSR